MSTSSQVHVVNVPHARGPIPLSVIQVIKIWKAFHEKFKQVFGLPDQYEVIIEYTVFTDWQCMDVGEKNQ